MSEHSEKDLLFGRSLSGRQPFWLTKIWTGNPFSINERSLHCFYPFQPKVEWMVHSADFLFPFPRSKIAGKTFSSASVHLDVFLSAFDVRINLAIFLAQFTCSASLGPCEARKHLFLDRWQVILFTKISISSLGVALRAQCWIFTRRTERKKKNKHGKATEKNRNQSENSTFR